MKLVKILDAKGTVLISDALNQMILQKLVTSQYSITELSRSLNVPVLKLWRRMQQLMKAKLVEVSGMERVGNLEKKLYRAVALRYEIPQHFFEPKLNDPNIQEAFGVYAKIQNEMMTILSAFDDCMPKEGDPTDFAIYAQMQAFVQIFEKSSTQEKIQVMKLKLSNFTKETMSQEPNQ